MAELSLMSIPVILFYVVIMSPIWLIVLFYLLSKKISDLFTYYITWVLRYE